MIHLMKHIVIVESPAKCKTIHKYLGKDYTVLASFGHIRDLPSKNGSVVPEEDFAMKYQISSDSKKQVKQISDAVKSADSLILATDPDREGEAISWHVLEMLKSKKIIKNDFPVKRVAFSSITKEAVNDAVANPRELDMNLVNAQQARRALDYLVGFNISPVLWRKLPGSKSAGRVQSVALRIICERETEIESFIPKEFWDVKAKFLNIRDAEFKATLSHVEGTKLEKFSFPDEESVRNVEKNLTGKDYAISKVTKKQVKRNPQAPFTTSTLQQEAARKLHFSATRTMQVAQKLYEGFEINGETQGLITYMRTDGVDVAPEAIESTRQMIQSGYGDKYLPAKPRVYKSKAKNAQEAHEAIRPTNPALEPFKIEKQLTEDQFKLYSLIWKRLISSQMESTVLDQVVAEIDSSDGYAKFRAVGTTVNFDGFQRVYNEGKDDSDDEDDENRLPELNQGESSDIKDLKVEQHFTQPPPRFSEASLVKKLEELGIGRPSTYASIISVLQMREYVKLEKKRFVPEIRGRLVTSFLSSFFPRYVEYDFTANLEGELDEISAGNLDWKKALENFWKDFSIAVDSAMEIDFDTVINTLNDDMDHILFPGEGSKADRRKCPKCKENGKEGQLGMRTGKFGAYLSCSNYPDCNYTSQLVANDSSDSGGEGGATLTDPKALGIDPKTSMEVVLKKGPYGFYVQLGEAVGKEKPKRASIPKGKNIDEIDLSAALSLLALPREVGMHPETGKKIVSNIGRYGPYIQHDGKFISLKGDDDVLSIGLNRAVTLIAEAPVKKGAEPLRNLGEHPDGGDVGVYEGRYGPYVKHGKINATIPKDKDKESITLEEALELIEKQAAKKGIKKKPAKKATTKKKAPAKKKTATKK